MKKILLDTDLGADCDDTGALALLHRCTQANKCELVAITLSTANPWSPHCTKAINDYYGRDLPLAQIARAPAGEDTAYYVHSYARHIAERFPLKSPPETELPVRLLRRTLAACEKGEAVLVVIGGCGNIAELLESGADEFSPLTGIELVREKVEKISLMGCFFPTEEMPEVWFGAEQMRAEWNIKQDVPAAQKVFSRCPVPVIVTQYVVGAAVQTGNVLIEHERQNPVAECYFVHSHGNRASWDPITAYYAVFGEDGTFGLSPRGTVEIDDEGVSSFVPNAEGKHRIVQCKNPAAAEKRIDEVLLGNI